MKNWALVVIALLAQLGASNLAAQEEAPEFFRIAVGPTSEADFPIGSALANAFTNPNRIENCETGEECGAPGVIGLAVASEGSFENLSRLFTGQADAAFASKAMVLEQVLKRRIEGGKTSSIRLIASLYPEAVHLITATDGNIWKMKDLEGKRIGIGAPKSGDQFYTRRVLEAYELTDQNVTMLEVDGTKAAHLLLEGEIDAFFHLAATPSKLVALLSSKKQIKLMDLSSETLADLIKSRGFEPVSLPGSLYQNVAAVNSIAVPKLFVTHEGVSKDLINKITRALWSQRSDEALTNIHASAYEITLDGQRQEGLIPWHPGATFYYATSQNKTN